VSVDPARVWEFAAIGTPWQVVTGEPVPGAVRRTAAELIERFDRDWSRFRADSLVTALARGAGSVAAPPDATAMLALYADASAATDGAVNPLVGDALAARGYDAGYGFADAGARPAPAGWRAQLTWTPASLALTAPATIDVGALGKGRLVDLVAGVIRAGLDGPVVVDGSGDIAVRGTTERIGLEHPYDPSRVIGVWEVTDAALCASAVTRRAWGDGLHHVLDARTGEPVRRIAATWAVAETAMVADAVATTLFFDGGPAFARAQGAQWVRMSTDGRVEWSPGCTADLFVRADSVEA